MIKRIAITGPESTGKSVLAKKLAEHFNTLWVEEYARSFLTNLKRQYVYDDILHIALQQMHQEDLLAAKANKLLFCDTDLLVTRIWCEVKFKKCHSWIMEEMKNRKYDLILLCDIDLNWEPDPLRENPDNRSHLFNLYNKALIESGSGFNIVTGLGNERFQNALRFVEKII